MKRVTVKGLLGISGTATIEIEHKKITLLCGDNAQGKSNLINLTKAAMFPRAIPPSMTIKDYGKAIINLACKEGSVTLEAPGLTRVVAYPTCEVKTIKGSQSIKFDEFAAQEISLPYLSTAQRGKWLADMLGARPTRKELEAEFEPLNISEAAQKRILDVYISSGPETAHKVADDFRKELTTEFKALTGEQWYVNKGIQFKPKGYSDDLEKCAVDELERKVVETEKAYFEARDMAALYRAAGDKEALLAEVEKWTATVLEREQSVKTATASTVKVQREKELLTCGSCGISGTIVGTKLVKQEKSAPAPEPTPGTLSLDHAQASLGNAQMALGVAKGNLDRAEGVGEYVDAQPFSDAWDLARVRLQAQKTKLASIALHYKILGMQQAMEVVSPDGMAKAKLLIGVKQFNKTLREYSELAGWETVQIDANLNLRYDEKAYHPHILSESERWRADTIFQIAYCMATEQELICIDRADIVVSEAHRGGLFNLLYQLEATALVGMAIDPEIVPPDLHCAGRTYLVEAGAVSTPYEAVAV
jgi:energy-coupling factor transporter ATP-binding protein EcfA2